MVGYVTCPKCGASVPEAYVMCQYCQAPIDDKTMVLPAQSAPAPVIPDNPLRPWVHRAYPLFCWILILFCWWGAANAAFFEKFRDQSGVRQVAIVANLVIGVLQLIFGICMLAKVRMRPKVVIFLATFGVVASFFEAQMRFTDYERGWADVVSIVVALVNLVCFGIFIYMFSSVEGFAEEDTVARR